MPTHKNIYFTGKKTALHGQLRHLPLHGLGTAIEKMGGTITGDLAEADNIIMGWYVNDWTHIETTYPRAFLMMEAKIDDFVQELATGIEELY